MKIRTCLRGVCAVVGLAAVSAVACPAHAQTAYAISNFSTLIRFDLATPGNVTTIGTFTGAATGLSGLDFRVSDGLLYGYTAIGNQIVTVNLTDASTTFVSNPTTSPFSDDTGLDFNPVVDRLRLVTPDDLNLRITPETGATDVDGTLTYAPGDVNEGNDPFVFDVAYTNNDTNAATGTQLYYIDPFLNTLVTTSAPNAGTLNTVGSLGVDTNGNLGFDIYTNAVGENFAYATLTTSGFSPELYSINLGTGQATLIGAVNAPIVRGLAIQPGAVTAAAAPEPSALGFLALPLVGAFLNRRRNR